MKRLILIALLAWPLLGQSEAGLLEGPFRKIFDQQGRDFYSVVYAVYRNSDGSKTLEIDLLVCEDGEDPPCSTRSLTGGNAFIINDYISLVIDKFNAAYADDVRHVVVSGNEAEGPPNPPLSSPLRSATAAAPQAVVLNGSGDNTTFLLDLTTFTPSKTVILPSGLSQTLGLRPALTGLSREVWTHHGSSTGAQIVITDLTTGRNAATIPVVTAKNSTAVDIVFSNDGKTAYVISTEQTPDADGNLAGIWIFDATTRTLKSNGRLPVVQVQSAIMAPDGLTIYLIGTDQQSRELITYYDVLSGTADLRVLAQEPLLNAAGNPTGLFNNLFPLGKVQMHPDGNRIFILHNFQVRAASTDSADAVSVFDLSQRKVTSKFPLTFTNGGKARKMEIDQSGTRLTILSDKGQLQFMDPQSGSITGSYQATATTFKIFTTPLIP